MTADKAAIRPFQVEVPEEELTELRRRINATRWPDRETVADKLGFFGVEGVSIPVVVRGFPNELYPTPLSWAERAYPRLVRYNKLDRGGHFAAWEQPQLLSREIRAGFRSLRK